MVKYQQNESKRHGALLSKIYYKKGNLNATMLCSFLYVTKVTIISFYWLKMKK